MNAKTDSKIAALTSLIASPGKTSARVKLQASKTLRESSAQSPQLIYPHFDFLVSLLRHDNSILRWNAILTLANLAPVDTGNRLERILDEYLAPIRGPRLIDAANTIRGAAVIALAIPGLADTIAKNILQAERANYATPECRNIAICHALSALERLFPPATAGPAISRFVLRQTDNPRTVTRNKAVKLQRKWARPKGTR